MTAAPLPAALSGQFGVLIVAVNVLLDQLGLPIPAVPTLLVAGALIATGQLPLMELVVAVAVVCVLADGGWYLAGRLWGNRVMRLLCRVSLTPIHASVRLRIVSSAGDRTPSSSQSSSRASP